MTVRFAMGALLGMAVAIALSRPSTVLGCSPAFNPTIEALGRGQVVLVGTTGEPVAGGRLFLVERWFNGGAAPPASVVIAFKEGEPAGDCSYPMFAGRRMIIAPEMFGGRLSASLATIQADPESDDGRRYLAEAIDLFGPGVQPAPEPPPVAPVEAVEPATSDSAGGGIVLAAVALAVTALFAGTFVVARRRPR